MHAWDSNGKQVEHVINKLVKQAIDTQVEQAIDKSQTGR
jgi:hypothetical protein